MKDVGLPKSIEEAEQILEREGFENPNLEARLLWDHVFKSSLNKNEENKLNHLREHLSNIYSGIPIQRQIGYTEVSGKKINITPDVLLPGPEIEVLLNTFFDYAKNPKKVIDLCTGCGVLASIIGEKFPKSEVYATDISEKALQVAKSNINSKNVKLFCGNLFEPLKQNNIYNVDILISNPPYCKAGDIKKLPRQIKDYTPRIAISAGHDGYYFHKRIIDQSPKYLKVGGFIILENEKGQTKELCKMLSERGYFIESTRKNKRGEERVVVARRAK